MNQLRFTSKAAGKALIAIVQASFLASTMLVTPLGVPLAAAANPSADLDQCANDPAPSPHTNGCSGAAGENGWVNGNLGASKSVYLEGDSIPYRMKFDNLALASHTVIIEWDTTKSGKHAIDYLTTWNRTVADSNPCLGVSGCSASTTFAIPADPQVTGGGVVPVAGNFTLFGGTITGVSSYTYPNGTGFAGDTSADIAITFTASVANPVLAWGGHIADRHDWGEGNAAIAIPGSPYHMRLIDLDGAGGNQDRSLSADAVIFPGSITIIKDATPNSSKSFPFTASPAPLANFSLVDDGTSANTKLFSGITAFQTYTVAETVPSGWDFDGYDCSVTSANGGSTADNGASGVDITMKEGENWTCTFSNSETPAPALSITKVATETGFSKLGDVIHYTITATNTGNVTLAAVTVTDPNVSNLDCSPANGSSLAAGASMTCTASHTIVQADLDAGHFYNQACVDDGAGGAASQCDDVDTPGSQNPALTITKVATESSFDSVGDVIHYTITATNTGNVTLAAVTVTDPNVSNLDCSPANGSSLAPGASMTCTASHTIVQADLDAGSFYNQACVDDGAGGAAQACDDVTTPGDQGPALSITKVATESGYDSVGDVIHYTITATNSGNVTLHNVTVTDSQVSDLVCSPTVPVASLAPGASISCTASHTVTQGDLDAGHFYNQACTDDGQGGAAGVCDDVDTPGSNNPALSITKVATESSYDSVGDVIHYTITATNSGNVTLHNVTVTDPNVSNLVCSPTVPVADLAPGASISCTASHTIVQADLDGGSFYNQACVDDGAGGAAQDCDDVRTPGDQNPALTIDKNATESGFSAVGDVIHYSITATNSGNVTLHNVDVTDPNVSNLDCTPATPVADLAPGASITCTASHTITQVDLDAGSFYNQACVDDGQGGAASQCDDVTTPGSQNPALSITKVATEQGFSAVGDVIHYTITATNTGNVTLHNVDVTDNQVSDLACLPATPVLSLDPGDSITCTASHTITQVDLDAGSFYNQACVDDGDGGAASQCDDVTTTGEQNPDLTITKNATEDSYSAVGDVIHYSITATNTGNVTLHNVDVTDPEVSNLDCSPATPVLSLDPGASITCTASHTITQLDLDAGSVFNEACVDDGEGGATEACDDVTTNGEQNAELSITKQVTEDGFTAIGQVLHYTIVATNTGNVTLHNVVVTDPNASNLVCDPALPVADLAPGDTIDCTADHTVTAADAAARFYDNEACVDDGDGPAAEACADVHSPGQIVGGETNIPTLPNTAALPGGGSGGPSSESWLLILGLGVLAAIILTLSPRPRRRRE